MWVTNASGSQFPRMQAALSAHVTLSCDALSFLSRGKRTFLGLIDLLLPFSSLPLKSKGIAALSVLFHLALQKGVGSVLQPGPQQPLPRCVFWEV